MVKVFHLIDSVEEKERTWTRGAGLVQRGNRVETLSIMDLVKKKKLNWGNQYLG